MSNARCLLARGAGRDVNLVAPVCEEVGQRETLAVANPGHRYTDQPRAEIGASLEGIHAH